MKPLLGTLAMCLLACAVSAQSLVEIARKEKERRKKVEAPESHSYTEADLRNVEGPMTQVTGGSAGTSGEVEESEAEAGAEEGEAEAEDPRRTEAYWRSRLNGIDQRIRDLETRLQSPQYTANPRGASEREALERQLEQARTERSAVVTEARQAGAPPGWLR